jgi:transposase
MVAGRIRWQRRRHSKEFKRRVVAETYEPGASVAAVARRHDLNANMVFLWRRDPRFGPARNAAVFLPVEVSASEVSTPAVAVSDAGDGRIEIALASGHRLTLSGAFDVDAVLRLARGLALP